MINTVLIVEDRLDSRKTMRELMEALDFQVDEAPTYKIAVEKLAHRNYDAVLLDMRLPDGRGINLFDTYLDKLAGKTIIVTADATIPGVVEAMKLGAFGYIEKPFEDELLIAQVNKIIELNRLQEVNQSFRSEVVAEFTFEKIIFQSKAMERVINKARVLAGTDNTILICGETGTGKEVLTRSIHNASPRNKKIFLPVNCAAVPAELFESELFGFEKGAFSGAVDSYEGRFIQADSGTLFLDEIGELPLTIQSKLLRVLDEHMIYRLKSHKPLKINVRLLAATNRDLEDEIKMRQFRGDLYFRLAEASIRIPPLRERPEDILPLAHHYVNVYNRIYNKEVKKMSTFVENFFLEFPWEGNVRQLKNTIKSIIPFKVNDIIDSDDLSHSVLEGKRIEKKRFIPLDEYEKRYIYEVLKVTGFNISKTSEMLDISRPRLYRKIQKLELENLIREE
ncbi:MAG: sigma-54-dependent Fis family transcriptional regulator [bacterium]|nr:sigma-54-dependent Fis family transcriptional regulator [bacterium]